MFRFCLSLSVLAFAAPAHADLMTGRVVDADGAGIALLDIDIKNENGDDPVIFNDGSDVNGFFAVTVPAGTYRVTFNPPLPPLSTSLVLVMQDVAIAGTTGLGTIVMPQGVALSGRALGPGGIPVAGVNLDIIDPAGENIDILGDTTDLLGHFSLAVPLGEIEVRFDTTPVLGQTIASEFRLLNLSGNTDMGDTHFEAGFVVTGIIRGPGAAPILDADVDAVDLDSGEKRYTPGDNTNASGFVDFVVAAGNYRFEICAPFDTRIAPVAIGPMAVTGNTTLGLVNHPAGVILSGTVRAPGGLPVSNVDIDFKTGGVDVLLCGDNTAADGTYAVVAAPGIYDLVFSPPFSDPLARERTSGFLLSGDTNFSPTLPPCPFFQDTGGGTAGSGGAVPTLSGIGGAPRLGNQSYGVRISGARGGSSALIAIGLGREPVGVAPFRNMLTQILDVRERFIAVRLDGTEGATGVGTGQASIGISSDPILLGETLVVRAYVRDPGTPALVARTNGIEATICE